MLKYIIDSFFDGLGKTLAKSFCRHVESIVKSGSSSSYEIARTVSSINKKDFNTNEKNLIYLLSNKKFQIDDSYWRMHNKFIFALLTEQKLIKKGDKIFIQVDFTSDTDDFLILCASVVFDNRSIPLYFTMRNYPKRKNSYDHKKMELAFLKGLKHILSEKHQYVIVADRGFGNSRFIDNCQETDFEYLIRLEPNFHVTKGNHKGIMRNVVVENGKHEVFVRKWDTNISVFRNEKKGKVWYLASNIKNIDCKTVIKNYEDRFKIEKCFQDLKSSGFDIEKSKIRKYDRFKRLVAMCMLAHVILVVLGSFIKNKMPDLLKKFPLHGEMILAYLQLEEKLLEN